MSSLIARLPIHPSAWTALLDKLVSPRDPARTVANCYALLEAHPQAAYNARVQSAAEFERLRLAAHRDWPGANLNLPDLARSGLTSVTALFSALCAGPILDRLSPLTEPITITADPAFGGATLLIGVERPGPVRRRKSDAGHRTQDEVSHLLRVLHPKLHIHRAVIDGIRLIPRLISEATEQHLETACCQRSAIRVAISPLTTTAQLTGRSFDPVAPEPERGFVLTSVGPLEPELAALDAAFAAAHAAEAALLVLPELRMPPELDRRLRELLDAQDPVRILLVAAGSWHIQEGQVWRNRCKFYDHQGETIFEHDKLAEFRLTADNLRNIPDLRADLQLDEHGGFENILRGERLHFCDTPIGRIALAICAGFFAEPARGALKAARADHYLVPAMSGKTHDLAKFADELVRHHGGSTAVANCATISQGTGSFVHSALWPQSRPGSGNLIVFDLLS